MGLQRSKLKNKSQTSPNIFGRLLGNKSKNNTDDESRGKSKSHDNINTVAEKVDQNGHKDKDHVQNAHSRSSSSSDSSANANHDSKKHNKLPPPRELPILQIFQNKNRRATMAHVHRK
jgi:hypothetical protein